MPSPPLLYKRIGLFDSVSRSVFMAFMKIAKENSSVNNEQYCISFFRRSQEGVSPIVTSYHWGGIPLPWCQPSEGGIIHPCYPPPSLLAWPTCWQPVMSRFLELLVVAILNKLKRRFTSWHHFRLICVLSEQAQTQSSWVNDQFYFNEWNRWPAPANAAHWLVESLWCDFFLPSD